MNRTQVEAALMQIGEARHQWRDRQREFDRAIDLLMERLLSEAAKHFLSVERVSVLAGFTPRQVRARMRSAGLDPKKGSRLLSEQARKILEDNARLLNIDPEDMDLTSPLAYLPMGASLREKIESGAVAVDYEEWDDSGEEMRAELIELLQPLTDHPQLISHALLSAGWHK